MTSLIELEVGANASKDNKPAPRSIGEQPGGLRNDTRMTIQTRQAQKIVVGRRGGQDAQPIIGLLNFGRRMKLVWLSAQANDPYADWYLLQVEESMNAATALMKDKRQWLDDVLTSMAAFDVGIAHSLEPIQISIVFQNPYGYMGAYLVADYDALCCSTLTALHIGLIDRKTAHGVIEAAGKALRRTFELPAKWKFTGVTRDDVAAHNPLAQRAREQFGDCPDPVLEGAKRARISPEIRVSAGKDNQSETETEDGGDSVLVQGNAGEFEDAEAGLLFG